MNTKEIKKASLPTWFKASVITASQGGKKSNSYYEVGYHVGIHLDKLIDSDNQEKIIDEFNNTNNLDTWCSKQIPHIMKFIPCERKEIFFKGIEEGIEKNSPF